MRSSLLTAGIYSSASLLIFSVFALVRNPGIRPGSNLLPLVPNISAKDVLGTAKPVLGSEKAKVKYVVFTDFQCPACGPEWEVLKQFASSKPDVAIYVRELPLEGMHPNARKLAIAAEVGRLHGKFAEVATKLYKSDFTDEAISNALTAAGISEEERRVSNPLAEQAVTNDLALANRWSLHSTPTVLLTEPDDKVYRVALFSQLTRIAP